MQVNPEDRISQASDSQTPDKIEPVLDTTAANTEPVVTIKPEPAEPAIALDADNADSKTQAAAERSTADSKAEKAAASEPAISTEAERAPAPLMTEARVHHDADNRQRGTRMSAILILALIAAIAGLWAYFSRTPEPTGANLLEQGQQASELPADINGGQTLTPTEPVIEETPVDPGLSTLDLDAPAQTESESANSLPQTLPPPEPVPPLEQSDAFVAGKVTSLNGAQKLGPLLAQQDLVRQFVVFVDNLAVGQLARKQSPVKGPQQKFAVSDIGNKTFLDPAGYGRYDLYANMLAGMSDVQLAALYNQLSPLLEQAFDELGYTDISFADRTQQAIDQLLEAPLVDQPMELHSVSVNFKFDDPALEALPPAQKLMIRMGPDNARKVKAALQKLRPLLQ
ncbi:DUF3014 domain-containing protein [Shewanella jiangmenensis]|nr:DUF3014 domain-containing protein [Shewanella jiangmenensis]